jgi:hypothetical protein
MKNKWKLFVFITFKKHLKLTSLSIATPCIIFYIEDYAFRKSYLVDVLFLFLTIEIEIMKTKKDAINNHLIGKNKKVIESILNDN